MKLTIIALGVLVASAAVSVHADEVPTVYGYCQASTSPYGRIYYFSSVFRLKANEYSVGVENGFSGHVNARYDHGTHLDVKQQLNSPVCSTFDTTAEAERELNAAMADARQDGRETVQTWWHFRGE